VRDIFVTDLREVRSRSLLFTCGALGEVFFCCIIQLLVHRDGAAHGTDLHRMLPLGSQVTIGL
jgi:hypothetical protein